MKVIDLVKKMANGEPLPKKIKCEEIIWELDEDNRIGLQYVDTSEKGDSLWRFLLCYIDGFNEEVEVIEEDKKIEKYNTGLDNGEWHEESVRKDIMENKNIEDYLIRVMKEVDAAKFKIFEIIDKINEENKE